MLHKMGFEYETEDGTLVHDDSVADFEANVEHFMDDGMDLFDARRRAESLLPEFTHAGKLAFASFHDERTAEHKASVNALVERMAELERRK